MSGAPLSAHLLPMTTLAYKVIRRVVNLLCFIMLVVTVGIIVYSFKPRLLENLEMGMKYRSGGCTNMMYYLAVSSLFSALLISTSINSKSKFTLKLTTICCLIYFLVLSLVTFYIFLIYPERLLRTIDGFSLSTDGIRQLSYWVSRMSSLDVGQHVPPDSVLDQTHLIAQDELFIMKYIFLFSAILLGVTLLLMLIGANCKISKAKSEVVKECETKPEIVGFASSSSLRGPRITASN